MKEHPSENLTVFHSAKIFPPLFFGGEKRICITFLTAVGPVLSQTYVIHYITIMSSKIPFTYNPSIYTYVWRVVFSVSVCA